MHHIKAHLQLVIKMLIIALLLTPFFVEAQSNNNSKKCKEPDENDLINFSTLSGVEGSIDSAKGWSKQDNGRWLSDENRIPFMDEKTNKSTSPERKLGYDNFIVIEMRKLMIDDRQYNVLIKKYHDGAYEFPILKEGWKSYKSLDYYVFSGKKLAEILPNNIPWNQRYTVNLNVFARGTIKQYKTKHWEDILTGQVQRVENAETINDWNLILAIFPIKNGDKEVCRFRMIKSFNDAYLPTVYTAPDNWKRIFDRSFYEVDFYKFKAFIRGAEENYIKVDHDVTMVRDPYHNYFNWGVLKYKTGDYPSAINFFFKALKINPNPTDFLIYSYLGNAESKMQKYSDAIGFYNKALDLEPKNVMDYSNWIKNYYNRGVTKFDMNNMTGACKDWLKAYELGFGPANDYIMEYCKDEVKQTSQNER